MASRSGLRDTRRSNCLPAMISRILLPTSMSLAAFGAAMTVGSAEAGLAGATTGRVTRSGAGLDDGAGVAFITGLEVGAGAKAGASARGVGRSVGEAEARVSGGTA